MVSKFKMFLFVCNDIFVLQGRGVVCRGCVEKGTVEVGTRVSFKTKEGTVEASIAAIELNRKLIKKTVVTQEIGLLLNQFDKAFLNNMINFTVEDVENLPQPTEILGIELPFKIIEVVNNA